MMSHSNKTVYSGINIIKNCRKHKFCFCFIESCVYIVLEAGISAIVLQAYNNYLHVILYSKISF